jgi:outer membrane protein assembly factor BamD
LGIIVVILMFFCVSCGGAQDSDTLDEYSQNAERQFQKAMDEFDDEDCANANVLFDEVKKQFPYSRFAALSELRIADCQFIQDNYMQAAIMYKQFIKTHPTHEDAHYAAYKRGLCFHEMIPGDWIITPPPHERDQTAARDARAAFSKFLNAYPDSPWRDKAIKLLEEVEDLLVRHEIYVAKFYLRRNDRRAAVVRLEGIQSLFPTSGLVPTAMFLQAITFLELNEIENAESTFNSIITHFPNHYQSPRAKDYLHYLGLNQQGPKRGGDG